MNTNNDDKINTSKKGTLFPTQENAVDIQNDQNETQNISNDDLITDKNADKKVINEQALNISDKINILCDKLKADQTVNDKMNTIKDDTPFEIPDVTVDIPDDKLITYKNADKIFIKEQPLNKSEKINILCDKLKADQAVIDVEAQKTTNKGGKEYCVMLLGNTYSRRKSQSEQGCTWSYLQRCGSTPPTGLDYKPETRNSFVKLVLTIVLIMLIATAIFVIYVLSTPDVKTFFKKAGLPLIFLALCILLIVHYAFICSPCSRHPPCNFVCLFFALVTMSLLSGVITSLYSTVIVLYAVLATTAVVLVCVLLACSNFDFTRLLLYVIVIGVALSVVFMIVMIAKLATGVLMKPVIIGLLTAATVFQSVVLTIQLQMILGGKTVELEESDYALGAFMIYTSIVDIFLKMVQIMGS